MSKFGGGSSSSNDKLIAQQKTEADAAAKREQERQQRLAYGREKIKAMFSLGGGQVQGPGSYRTVTTPATRTRLPPRYSRRAEEDGTWGQPQFVTTPGTSQEVFDPGATENISGIGQNFYDGFKNSVLEYQRPEVAKQFENAQSQNLYDLARRGTLRSSVAADNASDLLEEKALADARVMSDAENQTAGLRSDISRAQQNAISLLQATEDPTAAANAALTEVNAIQSRAPQFQPLGELFSAAARGYNSYQQGKNNRAWQSLAARGPHTSSGRNIA